MPPPANVFLPARELMLMMSPEPRRIMEGATARETRKTLLRLVSRTRSQSASVFSWTGPKRPMPALFTRMVMGPRAASVWAIMTKTATEFVTSAIWLCTGTPSAASSLAESLRAARSRPQMDTEAPSKANWCAMARPIPRLAPVTRATPPDRACASRRDSFDLLIRGMRNLPRTDHSFCATLILSLEFSAVLGIPAGREGIKSTIAFFMKKFPQVLKSGEEELLADRLRVSYNPEVFRNKAIPGRSIPG